MATLWEVLTGAAGAVEKCGSHGSQAGPARAGRGHFVRRKRTVTARDLDPEARRALRAARSAVAKSAPAAVAALLAGLTDPDAGRALVEIGKDGEEQRLMTGWASVVALADGTPVVDRQGDVLDLDNVQKVAHAFMAKGRAKAGKLHQLRKNGDGVDEKIQVGTIVESIVVTPALKEALALPEETPLGWLITAKIDDDETWEAAKRGELPMFSIGGKGFRTPAPELAHLVPDAA